MFKQAKRLRAISRNERVKVAQEFDRTEDDRLIIEVGAENYDSIISPYSIKNYLILNGDFSDYIISNSSQIPLKEDIQFDIYLKEEPTPTQKKSIANAIKVNFAERIVTQQQESKKTTWFGIFMLIFGLLTLAFCYFSHIYETNTFLADVFDIFAWVLLWDAFENFILDGTKNNNQQINNYRLMKARVVFRPYETEYPPIYTEDDNFTDTPKDKESTQKEDNTEQVATKKEHKIQEVKSNSSRKKDTGKVSVNNIKKS